MAYAPMSVTLTLDDEIDISRGDMMIAGPNAEAPAHSHPPFVESASTPTWCGWTSGRSIRRACTC